MRNSTHEFIDTLSNNTRDLSFFTKATFDQVSVEGVSCESELTYDLNVQVESMSYPQPVIHNLATLSSATHSLQTQRF